MSKNIIFAFVLSALLAQTIHPMASISRAHLMTDHSRNWSFQDGCVGAGFVGTAIYHKELSNTGLAKLGSYLLGTSEKDIVSAAMLGSVSWYMTGKIGNSTIKKYTQLGIVTAPLVSALLPGLADWLGKAPIIKHYFGATRKLQHIPIIGSCFSCVNKECPGLCAQCRLHQIYLSNIIAITAYYCFRKIVPNPFGEKAVLSLQEIEKIRQADKCCICQEDYTEITCPIIILPCGSNKHHMCKDCAQNYYNTHREPEPSYTTYFTDEDEIGENEFESETGRSQCAHCKPLCPVCSGKFSPSLIQQTIQQYSSLNSNLRTERARQTFEKEKQRAKAAARQFTENCRFKFDDDACTICSENFQDTILSCKHAFCRSCLNNWFQNNCDQTCPLCRKGVTIIDS